MIFRGIGRVHMVGIGGSGMSGIAEVLGSLGFRVTGSDASESASVTRLRSLGIPVAVGHDPAAVEGADVLVYSSAIRPDNPEVVRARALRIPVIRRAEMLAELMRMKVGIAVAGSHGKTTVTSLVAHICQKAGLDPTVIIGGRLDSLGGGARLGRGSLLIAEADESDGSFLRLSPVIGVVTNIDREHLDHYGDFASLTAAFTEFLNRLPFYGRGVVCTDDPAVRSVIPAVERPLVTYGLDGTPDLSAADIKRDGPGTTFTLVLKGTPLHQVSVPLQGAHNVRNTLAAIAVAMDAGVDSVLAREAVSSFRNAARRFEFLYSAGGIEVIDDYGHHPTEIRAVLATARGRSDGRIVVAFQPHRYSRTALLMDDFAAAFSDADYVLVTDIYPAGEQPIEGVCASGIVEGISRHGGTTAVAAGSVEEAAGALAGIVREGDTVITLGAGNIRRAAEILIARLGETPR
jgi:UDP-N-acetylmuramate--alanine ligase